MTLSGRLERTLDAVLRRSPAQPSFLRRASSGLVVLAYHEVADADAFTWQVEYLRTCMHPVSLADVIEAIRSRRDLPRRAVLITFDDGDRTVYERALPILRERGVPAVAFVIAGLLGTDTPFWWREVEELLRRGGRVPGLPLDPAECKRRLKRVPNDERLTLMERLRLSVAGPPVTMRQLQNSEVAALEAEGVAIGNHTFTHPCLDRCTDEAVATELVRAHEKLASVLGKAPVAFAYPNGNPDARGARLLAGLGYGAAFLFDHRIGRFPPPDRFRMSRVRIGSKTSPDRFRILVSGLHSSIHRLIGRA